LSNLTSCGGGNTDSKVLMSVHSSRLQAGYPSTVVVHNTGSEAVDVALAVYDARYGNRLGTYATGLIGANAQRSISIATIEAGARIAPGATLYHYVIKTDTAFTGYLQHLLTNASSGVVADMTAMCPLLP
jgi:4-aminobutyrate aminotransferase-like enzyme